MQKVLLEAVRHSSVPGDELKAEPAPAREQALQAQDWRGGPQAGDGGAPREVLQTEVWGWAGDAGGWAGGDPEGAARRPHSIQASGPQGSLFK